jgi:hypothetical protein
LNKDHPGILTYGHHHRAMFHCENELELDAVWMSITQTVKPDDAELPLLRAASKNRRAELRELKKTHLLLEISKGLNLKRKEPRWNLKHNMTWMI